MPTDAASADFDALLRGVSRSFYLSVRLLPPALRRPVALGYLLARASDTLADTAGRPAGERLSLLDALGGAIQHGRPWHPADGAAFVAAQHDPQERALIAALPACLGQLATLRPDDLEDVRTVLRHIVRGQTLDLQRFPGTPVCALPDAAALEEYAFLVAGSVGEFWTRVCVRHLPDFADAPPDRMADWGRTYGTGLQLLNIVRDAGADLALGRCYLPADELAAAGLADPALAASQPALFEPVWQHWLAQARIRLDAGMGYASAVRSRRVRAACALPALLGARTASLLAQAGPQAWTRRVKMPRREVRGVLWRVALTLAAVPALQRQYRRLGGWENPAR